MPDRSEGFTFSKNLGNSRDPIIADGQAAERIKSPLKDGCNLYRRAIKGIAGELHKFLKDQASELKNRETASTENVGEMLANLTLAYRHLEDASSRLGKALQASDGGVSVYDRSTTVGA